MSFCLVFMENEKALFAAGCFWGVQAKFQRVKGVLSTRVGYTGGHADNPKYRQVCSKDTGHAEAIEITFNPSKVSYEELLDLFWMNHDPTTLNRQGPDIGDQYRSAIFYVNDEQREVALKSKEKQENMKLFKSKIVTQIVPASEFWEAEEYHQNYIEKTPLRFRI